MADPWYPEASDYYVPSTEEAAYPVRQGDVFGIPPATSTLPEWKGFVVVHPSCEVQTGKSKAIQVARLHAVSEHPDPLEQTRLTFGLSDDDGKIKVAFAHTFWLPPASDSGFLAGPLYANFREVALVDLERVDQGLRARALTHDVRVYFIRRKLHFRYRWNLSVTDVRNLEAARIRADSAFSGPKPEWASD